MKQVLFAVLAVLILFAIAFVIAGFAVPSSYEVTRDIVIESEAAKIYKYVGHLDTWPDWTSWNTDNYPELKYEMGEKTEGVGASQSWIQDSARGELTVTEASPDTGIRYKLVFDETLRSEGQLRFEPTDGGTKVTWTNGGDLPFMMRPITIFLSLEDNMGQAFEEGLNNLKVKVEG